jgi:hypothetical protein
MLKCHPFLKISSLWFVPNNYNKWVSQTSRYFKSTMTLSITLFSIMTLSLKGLYFLLRISNSIIILCHYAEWRYAEYRILLLIMQNVVILGVVMMNVVMLSVVVPISKANIHNCKFRNKHCSIINRLVNDRKKVL